MQAIGGGREIRSDTVCTAGSTLLQLMMPQVLKSNRGLADTLTDREFRSVGARSSSRRPLPSKEQLYKPTLLSLILTLLPLNTTPAELVNVEVKKEGKRYFVRSESSYKAPPEAIFAVLLDYENFDQVSSVFKESYFVDPAEDGTPRAYTKVKGCLIFYCVEFERIDRLYFTEYSEIIAESEPNPDDFRYSRSQWKFESEGEKTTVHYQMEMEPGFWVPPVVGSYFLKRRLKSGARDTVDRVERVALGRVHRGTLGDTPGNTQEQPTGN